MRAGSLHAWKTYLISTLVFSIVFGAMYFSFNALTAHRSGVMALYLPGELRIPFLPGFIWIYATFFVLWPLQAVVLPSAEIWRLTGRLLVAMVVSGVCFLLFPARLGFVRELPADPFLAKVFAGLFQIDRVHNLVPSLHVLNSTLILAAFIAHSEKPWLRALWAIWLALIMASTLFVHQHHLLDVGTGLLIGILIHALMAPARAGAPVLSVPALGEPE